MQSKKRKQQNLQYPTPQKPRDLSNNTISTNNTFDPSFNQSFDKQVPTANNHPNVNILPQYSLSEQKNIQTNLIRYIEALKKKEEEKNQSPKGCRQWVARLCSQGCFARVSEYFMSKKHLNYFYESNPPPQPIVNMTDCQVKFKNHPHIDCIGDSSRNKDLIRQQPIKNQDSFHEHSLMQLKEKDPQLDESEQRFKLQKQQDHNIIKKPDEFLQKIADRFDTLLQSQNETKKDQPSTNYSLLQQISFFSPLKQPSKKSSPETLQIYQSIYAKELSIEKQTSRNIQKELQPLKTTFGKKLDSLSHECFHKKPYCDSDDSGGIKFVPSSKQSLHERYMTQLAKQKLVSASHPNIEHGRSPIGSEKNKKTDSKAPDSLPKIPQPLQGNNIKTKKIEKIPIKSEVKDERGKKNIKQDKKSEYSGCHCTQLNCETSKCGCFVRGLKCSASTCECANCKNMDFLTSHAEITQIPNVRNQLGQVQNGPNQDIEQVAFQQIRFQIPAEEEEKKQKHHDNEVTTQQSGQTEMKKSEDQKQLQAQRYMNLLLEDYKNDQQQSDQHEINPEVNQDRR